MDLAAVALTVSVGAFLLELLIVVVAGVWIVAEVKGSTRELGTAINGLASTIGELKSWMLRLDDASGEHSARLARIEERIQK